MKYYVFDVCNFDYNDEEGEKRFLNAQNEAEKEYLKIKNHFPDEFNELYQKNNFHDYIIRSLNLVKKTDRTGFDLVVVLACQDKSWEIKYCSVKNYNINLIMEDDYCEFGDYLYGEILKKSNDTFTHEFYVYDFYNIVYVEFEKIVINIIN